MVLVGCCARGGTFQMRLSTAAAGGLFVFLEPASAEAKFGTGLGEWKQRRPTDMIGKRGSGSVHVNALPGFGHTPLSRPVSTALSATMTSLVAEWVRLLESGFRTCDVVFEER